MALTQKAEVSTAGPRSLSDLRDGADPKVIPAKAGIHKNTIIRKKEMVSGSIGRNDTKKDSIFSFWTAPFIVYLYISIDFFNRS